MKKTLFLTAALAAFAGASAASAATIAPAVYDYVQGYVGPAASKYNAADRYDTANVNNGDSTDFLALGVGGYVVFYIPQGYAGSVTLSEITYDLTNYEETATILGGTSYDGTLTGFTTLGSVSNAEASTGTTLSFSGTYTWLAILDTSDKKITFDGFDIDTVEVSPVPLPAAAPLLALALGGLGVAARRRKQHSA